VWSALTEPQRLARWLADAELDLRLGGRYVLRFAGDDESQVTRGEVLAVEPKRLLELFWWYPGESDTIVHIELRPDGDGTILILDHGRLPVEPAAATAPVGTRTWTRSRRISALAAEPDWLGRYRELAPLYEAQEAELEA
jgi:uncharacterized protein YndB with AHSA1/START domain